MTGRPGAPLPVTEHPVPDRPRRTHDHDITAITAALPPQQPAARVRPPPAAALAPLRPIPVTGRLGAPVPAATQAPAASLRRRASDSDIASYRVTAQRVLDEHERSTAAPTGAPARVRFAPSPAAPARATAAVAPWRAASFAAAAANLSAAQRSSALAQQTQAQRRAAPRRLHDDLIGLTGAVAGSSAARAETPHAALDSGVAADGSFSGASVFVVCQHGALMGRANGLWQDFGGRRDGNESPYQTAFRELREEIGLTADHVDLLPDQPVWVVHAAHA